LKIEFAYFLMYKMANKKEALTELKAAEKKRPNFQQQFLIYRLRHLVEDELSISSGASGGG